MIRKKERKMIRIMFFLITLALISTKVYSEAEAVIGCNQDSDCTQNPNIVCTLDCRLQPDGSCIGREPMCKNGQCICGFKVPKKQEEKKEEYANLEVKSDKENIVANRLEGKWVLREDLTKKLGGSLDVKTIEFISEQNVVKKLSKKYENRFKNKQIFMAGYLKIGSPEVESDEQKYIFILVEMNGQPRVIFFIKSDGDPTGDSESIILFIAQGKEKKNDILFMGGDHAYESFIAFQRAEKQKEKEEPKKQE